MFYWLPKIHKKPYGARFIAASKTPTTKPLSKLLTSGLKLITNHFRQYCNVIFCSTVELVYSGHPSEAAKWLLYTGGLLIEVFNVYVAHGKIRWDFAY